MIVAGLICFRYSKMVVEVKVTKFVQFVTFPVLDSLNQFTHCGLFSFVVGHLIDFIGDALYRSRASLELRSIGIVVLFGSVENGLAEMLVRFCQA